MCYRGGRGVVATDGSLDFGKQKYVTDESTSRRNSGDAYGYSMYRKLLPKFLDMIDMSLLDDESKEAYKQSLTSGLERTSKSADSTKKCSNDNLKSAQTTVSIKHYILTEKVFVR